MKSSNIALILFVAVVLLTACGNTSNVEEQAAPENIPLVEENTIDVPLNILNEQYWAQNISARENFANLLMQSYSITKNCVDNYNLVEISATSDGRSKFSFETSDGAALGSGYFCGSLEAGSATPEKFECRPAEGIPNRLECFSSQVTEGEEVSLGLDGFVFPTADIYAVAAGHNPMDLSIDRENPLGWFTSLEELCVCDLAEFSLAELVGIVLNEISNCNQGDPGGNEDACNDIRSLFYVQPSSDEASSTDGVLEQCAVELNLDMPESWGDLLDFYDQIDNYIDNVMRPLPKGCAYMLFENTSGNVGNPISMDSTNMPWISSNYPVSDQAAIADLGLEVGVENIASSTFNDLQNCANELGYTGDLNTHDGASGFIESYYQQLDLSVFTGAVVPAACRSAAFYAMFNQLVEDVNEGNLTVGDEPVDELSDNPFVGCINFLQGKVYSSGVHLPIGMNPGFTQELSYYQALNATNPEQLTQDCQSQDFLNYFQANKHNISWNMPFVVWSCAIDSQETHLYQLFNYDGWRQWAQDAWMIDPFIDSCEVAHALGYITPGNMYLGFFNYVGEYDSGTYQSPYDTCSALNEWAYDPTAEVIFGTPWDGWGIPFNITDECEAQGWLSHDYPNPYDDSIVPDTAPEDVQGCVTCSVLIDCSANPESDLCQESPPDNDSYDLWDMVDACGADVGWTNGTDTYAEATALINYLTIAAPLLEAGALSDTCISAISYAAELSHGSYWDAVSQLLTLYGFQETTACTQTPFSFMMPAVAETSAETAENTDTGTSDRCALFEEKDYSLTLLNIQPSSSALTLYVSMSGGVPGLETPVPGDEAPWEYSATLGSSQASSCSFPGYTNRLYCDFNLPGSYVNSIRPLNVYVNGCENPIYSNDAVSIVNSGSDGSGGSNNNDACVQPPYPDPQNACWIWFEDLCQWVCVN
jgi:hypothetical protein